MEWLVRIVSGEDGNRTTVYRISEFSKLPEILIQTALSLRKFASAIVVGSPQRYTRIDYDEGKSFFRHFACDCSKGINLTVGAAMWCRHQTLLHGLPSRKTEAAKRRLNLRISATIYWNTKKKVRSDTNTHDSNIVIIRPTDIIKDCLWI